MDSKKFEYSSFYICSPPNVITIDNHTHFNKTDRFQGTSSIAFCVGRFVRGGETTSLNNDCLRGTFLHSEPLLSLLVASLTRGE